MAKTMSISTQPTSDDAMSVDTPTETAAGPAGEVAQTASFLLPSIDKEAILNGQTYPYYSPLPPSVTDDASVECVLGVDEAGRGPVLGPMVYAVYYLPKQHHYSVLREQYKFADSKVLSPEVRQYLMESICLAPRTGPTPAPRTTKAKGKTGAESGELADLSKLGGYATMALSPPSISAGMMPAAGKGTYNLNAQAMDATISLIKGVIARGVNITEIYIDTIGKPETYQAKLAPLFPKAKVKVEKKADAVYPVVSAASIVAKVTRDSALEVLWEEYTRLAKKAAGSDPEHWGCGYPSDARTIAWLKQDLHPLFGWGPECRFSWSTVRDLLEGPAPGTRSTSSKATKAANSLDVDWAQDLATSGMSIMEMIEFGSSKPKEEKDDKEQQPVLLDGARISAMSGWFGQPVLEDYDL